MLQMLIQIFIPAWHWDDFAHPNLAESQQQKHLLDIYIYIYKYYINVN